MTKEVKTINDIKSEILKLVENAFCINRFTNKRINVELSKNLVVTWTNEPIEVDGNLITFFHKPTTMVEIKRNEFTLKQLKALNNKLNSDVKNILSDDVKATKQTNENVLVLFNYHDENINMIQEYTKELFETIFNLNTIDDLNFSITINENCLQIFDYKLKRYLFHEVDSILHFDLKLSKKTINQFIKNLEVLTLDEAIFTTNMLNDIALDKLDKLNQ